MSLVQIRKVTELIQNQVGQWATSHNGGHSKSSFLPLPSSRCDCQPLLRSQHLVLLLLRNITKDSTRNCLLHQHHLCQYKWPWKTTETEKKQRTDFYHLLILIRLCMWVKTQFINVIRIAWFAFWCKLRWHQHSSLMYNYSSLPTMKIGTSPTSTCS